MTDPTTLVDGVATPASLGFAMPAEWDTHAGCLMQWPSRRELWRDRFDDARDRLRRRGAGHRGVRAGRHGVQPR